MSLRFYSIEEVQLRFWIIFYIDYNLDIMCYRSLDGVWSIDLDRFLSIVRKSFRSFGSFGMSVYDELVWRYGIDAALFVLSVYTLGVSDNN